jgi:hypothetical protein
MLSEFKDSPIIWNNINGKDIMIYFPNDVKIWIITGVKNYKVWLMKDDQATYRITSSIEDIKNYIAEQL